MLRTLLAAGLLLVVLLEPSARTAAEDWPGWRGPRGDGTSHEDLVPLHWNGEAGRNIAWKVPLPGEGMGSPIVRGERVFLVSCLTETQERILVCFDRATGSIRWQRPVIKSPLEIKHRLNSFASSTPAADTDTVYVTFLEIDGSEAARPECGNAAPSQSRPDRRRRF